jgi:delta11-fatty-acid desaturase
VIAKRPDRHSSMTAGRRSAPASRCGDAGSATLKAVVARRQSLITRIHGRYYDVGGFEHPGGCPALECARDRDATALFESYHALHRARPIRTLSHYEITPDLADADHRFLAEKRFGDSGIDWDATLASPFSRDLFDHCRRYFEAERQRRGLRTIAAATRAPLRRWLEVAALGLLFFAALAFYIRGDWFALVAAPVLGWLFLVNFWHDSLHFAMSRSWRANAMLPYLFPWFISPKLWMHQHVIGHHVFPNDPLRDPDVRAAPRVLRQNPAVPWCPAHGAQRRTGHLLGLYSVVCLTRNLLRDHLTHLWGWFNEAVPLVFATRRRRLLHIAGRLTVAWSLYVWPFQVFAPGKALMFAIVPSLLLSELFLLFSQVNHITHESLAGAGTRSANWYEAQVLSSCSYATNSCLAFLVSGGLNLQIEHHLLPGVNHFHLLHLAPAIRQICERHGVPYHSYPSFRAALAAHFACMRRLAAPPAATVTPTR